jgi:hypothetical protein
MAEFITRVSADPYVRHAGPVARGKACCYEPQDDYWDQQWRPENIYRPNAWDEQVSPV